jgi:hypothetical protein
MSRVLGPNNPIVVEMLADHPVFDRRDMRVERLQTGDYRPGIAVEAPGHCI